MTTFFTSDTHFSHKNIIHLGKGRPFTDIHHHNEMLIRNWNSTVMPDDIVIHLGDVALGPWPEGLDCVKRLNGFKILVPGNHDKISTHEKPARREKFRADYENAFDDIWPEVVSLDHTLDTPAQASHYPVQEVFYDNRPDRYMDLRPKDDGRIIIHGHTHTDHKISRTKRGTLQIHVGVDSWDYTPVSEHQIAELIEQNA